MQFAVRNEKLQVVDRRDTREPCLERAGIVGVRIRAQKFISVMKAAYFRPLIYPAEQQSVEHPDRNERQYDHEYNDGDQLAAQRMLHSGSSGSNL